MKPYYDKSGITIYYGDCLEVMKQLPDKSFDLVLTDPPYGITACEWDTIPDLDKLWEVLKPLGKDRCAYVFTASQPFTSKLIMSNLKWFKYEWIWDKKKGGNPLLAKIQPIKVHENILVFGRGKINYFPEMKRRDKEKWRGNVKKGRIRIANYVGSINKRYTHKYPKSILTKSNADQSNRFHPTQKPVALMEYLVKTYTNEGNIILDPFLGSGTTLVAAKKLGRRAVGIEISEKYCEIAVNRLKELDKQPTLWGAK